MPRTSIRIRLELFAFGLKPQRLPALNLPALNLPALNLPALNLLVRDRV